MASFNIKRFIKNPIKGLENAGRSIGKIAKQAAPVVGLIPGVGTALGAGIGAAGSVLSGGNVKSHLKSGVAGGLSGLANTQLLGGQGIKGIGSALGMGGGGIRAPQELDMGQVFSGLPGMGGGTAAAPATAASGGIMGRLGGMLSGGRLGGGIKSVGKWALKNPDAILGGLSAVQGLKKGRQADQMMEQAMNDPGLNPMRPDASSTFSGYSNPYSGGQAAIPSVGIRGRRYS